MEVIELWEDGELYAVQIDGENFCAVPYDDEHLDTPPYS